MVIPGPVFPARAGMILLARDRLPLQNRIPRESGDDPDDFIITVDTQ